MNTSSLISLHAERHGKAGRIEETLYNLGAIGQGKKCTAEILMNTAGIRTKRDLCLMVRRERAEGALLCSTKKLGGGYYLPETTAEVQAFIDTYSAEARSLFWMQKHFRQFLKDHDEQA